jgi:1-acyl-sn-glycerol-3-phosphate acyltransferase
MGWLKDPIGPNHPKIGIIYRILRRFSRSLMSVWFRELDIVDNENLPPDGGLMFIAWHPSGLIDPILMHASLPGKLSILAKHTLFKIPIFGRLIRSGGALPIERASDSNNKEKSRKKNADMLSKVGNEIANGGRLLLFPEGTTHTESSVKKARSGAARIMLQAIRESIKLGTSIPRIIPVGLHYSNSQKFRERGAVILERPMELPEVPINLDSEEEQNEQDGVWISNVTQSIDYELKRASHSKTSWEDRHLIWQARSVVYAERIKQSGEKMKKPNYSESVYGARRMRAGWEFIAKEESKKSEALVNDSIEHFNELGDLGLSPFDIAAKPEKPSIFGYLKAIITWIWSAAWMLGLVTWSAIVGNAPPYQANYVFMWYLKKRDIADSIQGTMKVMSAVVMFPIWWVISSLTITWLLLSHSSPVYVLLNMHWLLAKLTLLNPIIVFLIFLIWWPVSGKMHLRLYSKLVQSWRMLKRWQRWRGNEHDWDSLYKRQRLIGERLVSIGDSLVLPGDPDWISPPTGQDDVLSVKYRS